jgi:uncharacterized membrane protein YfcA
MSTLQVVLICSAVCLGATTQRMTGLGFALVAAPFLVLIAGPAEGVSLGNALSAILCLGVVVTTWRHVRWKSAMLLLVPALIAIPLGSWVVRVADPKILLVVVGSMSLLAVLTVILSKRTALLPGRTGAVIAGALSGFMNTTAGVGGPMMAVHSLSERWTREVFIGTAQVFLLAVNILSLVFKGIPTTLPWWLWSATVGALVIGAVIGHYVSPLIPQRLGNNLVLLLALVGSGAAILRGLLMP